MYNRRQFIQTLGASGIIALGGCAQSSSPDQSVTPTNISYNPVGNYPVAINEATFGCLVPESGLPRSIGDAYREGFDLAIEHLNTGGSPLAFWSELSGAGVQDRQINSVIRNTASDPGLAQQQALQSINADNVQMLTGGISGSTVTPVLQVCQRQRVPFLSGTAHTNVPSGQGCTRYGFREMINARQTAAALAHFYKRRLSPQSSIQLLYADYSWGRTQLRMIEREFSRLDASVETQSTVPAQTSYREQIDRIPRSTDLLCIIQRGLDATTMLEDISAAGLSSEMELCVPLWSRLTAQSASEYLEGVIGTVPWSWQLRNQVSIAFVESFRNQYNHTPTYESLIGYIQPLQYAAAVERAGTFYPPAVIRQLENHTYDNAGLGTRERLRKCDHQAIRDIPIVSGRAVDNQQSDRFFRLETVINREQTTYDCTEIPASECELGSYS